MSDTTGWVEIHPNLHHLIDLDNKRVWIAQRVSSMWGLWLFGLFIDTRPTLRECQILAHDTARLWAGDEE